MNNIALGIPLYGNVYGISVMHLLNHVAYGVAEGRYGYLDFREGAYIDRAENEIVAGALKDEGITHVFFHEQDVIVPEGVLPRLLSHDLPIVAAGTYGRDVEHKPVAFDIRPFKRLDELEDYDGLNKVGGVHLGATLIKRHVFEEMKEHFQDEWWFRCTEPQEGGEGRRTGQDIWFAERCADLGIPIYLDAGADCGHAGVTVWTKEDHLVANRRWQRMHQVDEWLAFGARNAHADVWMVVDCAFEQPEGDHYRFWQFDDGPLPDLAGLWSLVDEVYAAREQQRKVLIRCEGGNNRSALVAALSLVRSGMSGGEALAAIQKAHGGALFNRAFADYVARMPPGGSTIWPTK